MEVQLCDNTLPDNTALQVFQANPDTGLVCLNDIYTLGNQARELRGYPKKSLKDFVRSRSTVEFLISLEERYNGNTEVGNSHLAIELDSKGRAINIEGLKLKYFYTEKGDNAKTWIHPLVALEALGKLDSRVRVLAYEQLYTLGIMGNRIESSDSFKELNAAYKKAQEGRSVFKFDYLHIANAIADKIGMPKKPKGQKDFNRWNSATAEQLALRSLVQDNLVFLLETKQISTRVEVLKIIHEFEID